MLLLHFYSTKKLSCSLSMESIRSQKSVLDIEAAAREHKDILDGLLACHAMSGCDTVAKLSGIGKVTALKVLKSGLRLERLGDLRAPMAEVIAETTCF